MMSDLYTMFASDKDSEKDGILVNYGNIRFRIARAGGHNTGFRRLLQAKMKPYKHQLDNDLMDDQVSEGLVREAYAEAVIKGWETRVTHDDGTETWQPWLQTPEGNTPYSVAACVKVLSDLPDVFRDIQSVATKAANFRLAEEGEDAKN